MAACVCTGQGLAVSSCRETFGGLLKGLLRGERDGSTGEPLPSLAWDEGEREREDAG